MNLSKIETGVLTLICAGVGSMAGAASFTHVHDWTMNNSPDGTPGWFGWANASISELVPVASVLVIRRRIRSGAKAGLYPVVLIVASVALSLSGQFAQAVPSVSGWLLSAVPAVAFLALVKLVLAQVPTVEETVDKSAATDVATAISPHTETAAAAPVREASVSDVVSADLLETARFKMDHHRTVTGEELTVAELAKRLDVNPDVAQQLLSRITGISQMVQRSNGSPVAEVGA